MCNCDYFVKAAVTFSCGILSLAVCLHHRTHQDSLFRQLGGTMRCTSCGKTIPDESNFCNHCGKPVGTTENVPYRSHPCGFCNGRGRTGAFETTICLACGGKGNVLVLVPEVKCAFCNGRGKTGAFDNKACPACNGTGWAHIVK